MRARERVRERESERGAETMGGHEGGLLDCPRICKLRAKEGNKEWERARKKEEN